MAQSTQSVSTSVKIRFPRETLKGLEQWAAAHDMTRSQAIRALAWRGLVTDWGDWKCNCCGADQCTGACSEE
jgi:hypothetical protein